MTEVMPRKYTPEEKDQIKKQVWGVMNQGMKLKPACRQVAMERGMSVATLRHWFDGEPVPSAPVKTNESEKTRVLELVREKLRIGFKLATACRMVGDAEGFPGETVRYWFRSGMDGQTVLPPVKKKEREGGRGYHRTQKYEPYSDAVNFAYLAMHQLERITMNDPRKDEALLIIKGWVKKMEGVPNG